MKPAAPRAPRRLTAAITLASSPMGSPHRSEDLAGDVAAPFRGRRACREGTRLPEPPLIRPPDSWPSCRAAPSSRHMQMSMPKPVSEHGDRQTPRARHGSSLPRCGELAFRTPNDLDSGGNCSGPRVSDASESGLSAFLSHLRGSAVELEPLRSVFGGRAPRVPGLGVCVSFLAEVQEAWRFSVMAAGCCRVPG